MTAGARRPFDDLDAGKHLHATAIELAKRRKRRSMNLRSGHAPAVDECGLPPPGDAVPNALGLAEIGSMPHVLELPAVGPRSLTVIDGDDP